MAIKRRPSYYWLVFKEFLSPKNVGGLITPQGLKGDFYSKTARCYLAVSHALLSFFPVRLPSHLPAAKRKKAAEMEARRLFKLLFPHATSVSLASWEGGENVFWVAVAEKSKLEEFLKDVPENMIISGVFPMWVSLWCHFKPQEDGLYFIRTPWAYEGFVYKNGRIVEIMPSSLHLGETYLEGFEGSIHEIQGDPEEILIKSSQEVPLILPKGPVFSDWPLRIRPQIPKKSLILWLLPLLVFSSYEGLKFYDNRLGQEITSLENQISKLKQIYQTQEQQRKKIQKLKKLEDLTKSYFDRRPPLLDVMYILTETLPQNTWVTRFVYKQTGDITLWVQGEDALKIVEKLSQDPIFKEVKLGSSVTRNPRTGKESFTLILKLRKPYKQKQESLKPSIVSRTLQKENRKREHKSQSKPEEKVLKSDKKASK